MQVKSTKDIKPTKINMLIIGESGAGKTTLAKTLTGKTIVVSLESGLLSLKDYDIDYVELEERNKLGSLRSILEEIKKSDYENIYFDSLTEIAQCFVEDATKEYPEDSKNFKKWGLYNETFMKFLKYTRDMDKNVFYTCLQKPDKDDVGRKDFLPDIPGSISKRVGAHMDFVFYLKIFTKEGEKARALLTSSIEGYAAKDRSGKLKEYELPDLGAIIEKVF